MEEDLIARGIVLATFNWPLRAKYFFYAHGGTLNMEDVSFVTSDAIREAVNKLNDALKAMSEGSFKLDREKDELDIHSRDTQTHWTCPRHGRISMEAWL
jgi:hypothetical protein